MAAGPKKDACKLTGNLPFQLHVGHGPVAARVKPDAKRTDSYDNPPVTPRDW